MEIETDLFSKPGEQTDCVGFVAGREYPIQREREFSYPLSSDTEPELPPEQ
jgi:hypothetical protein